MSTLYFEHEVKILAVVMRTMRVLGFDLIIAMLCAAFRFIGQCCRATRLYEYGTYGVLSIFSEFLTMYSPITRGDVWVLFCHDNVIKWKYFPRHWPFVRGIHRWPVNSPHKGLWRRALMFSLICAWIRGWVNNREAGDLRRHRAHCDVTVMRVLALIHGAPGLQQWCKHYRIILDRLQTTSHNIG